MVEPYIEYSRWSPCLRCGLEHRMCRCPEGWVPDPDNPRSPILVKVRTDLGQPGNFSILTPEQQVEWLIAFGDMPEGSTVADMPPLDADNTTPSDGVGPFDSGRWAYRNGAVNGRGKVR